MKSWLKLVRSETERMCWSGGRPAAAVASRLVIKIGSAALGGHTRVVAANVGRLARAVGKQMAQGRQFVVVSSGAVAVGRMLLGADPNADVEARTAACVGQAWLTARYRKAFAAAGFHVAQLLLVDPPLYPADSDDALRGTLGELLKRRCVPVLNENFGVAEHFIGNNDVLAVRIATLISADLVVLLTDVPGVFPMPPGVGEYRVLSRLGCPEHVASVVANASRPGSPGIGGMAAKLSAAREAAEGGVPVLIGALPDLPAMLAGHEAGTLVAWSPPSTEHTARSAVNASEARSAAR